MGDVIDLEAKRRERAERKKPAHVLYVTVNALDRSAEDIARIIDQHGPFITDPPESPAHT